MTPTVPLWRLRSLKLLSNYMHSFYFQTQEEARQWAATQQNRFTLRRVNLEDAFLALTGKKIQ